MDWSTYKALCDSPRMFSRWMLEQSVELLRDEPDLADALRRSLAGPVLDKPPDHRGGSSADMFELVLGVTQARRIHRVVRDAANAGRRTTATTARGLGGFAEAWQEYVRFAERAAINAIVTDREDANE